MCVQSVSIASTTTSHLPTSRPSLSRRISSSLRKSFSRRKSRGHHADATSSLASSSTHGHAHGHVHTTASAFEPSYSIDGASAFGVDALQTGESAGYAAGGGGVYTLHTTESLFESRVSCGTVGAPRQCESVMGCDQDDAVSDLAAESARRGWEPAALVPPVATPAARPVRLSSSLDHDRI